MSFIYLDTDLFLLDSPLVGRRLALAASPDDVLELDVDDREPEDVEEDDDDRELDPELLELSELLELKDFFFKLKVFYLI
jgi:hypothetical protein